MLSEWVDFVDELASAIEAAQCGLRSAGRYGCLSFGSKYHWFLDELIHLEGRGTGGAERRVGIVVLNSRLSISLCSFKILSKQTLCYATVTQCLFSMQPALNHNS